MKTYNDLRKAYLVHGNIATEAYYMWEKAGRPDGQNEKYWYAALEKLEMAAEMDGDQLNHFSEMGRRIIADGTA